jgi:hypothetical protein
VGSDWIDIPELKFDLSLVSSMGINLGAKDSLFSASARTSSGLDLGVSYDLNDDLADAEGKLRMGDLIVQLFTDPLGLGGIDATLEASLGLQAGAVLDLEPATWGILEGSTTYQSIVWLLAEGIKALGGGTEFTLLDIDERLKFTLLDSDPFSAAPSLVDLVAQLATPSTPVL